MIVKTGNGRPADVLRYVAVEMRRPVFPDTPLGSGLTVARKSGGSRKRKLAKRDIPAALGAHSRAQKASDEIRRRAGLAPLPENAIVRAWRAQAPKRQRARKVPALATVKRHAKAHGFELVAA